jgi:hypothetical protein
VPAEDRRFRDLTCISEAHVPEAPIMHVVHDGPTTATSGTFSVQFRHAYHR